MLEPGPDSDRAARDAARADAIANPITVRTTATIVTFLFFALAVILCAVAFADVVPPRIMSIWRTGAAAFLMLWLVATVTFLVRRPNRDELVRLWARVSVAIALGANIVVVSTIWLFLPTASSEHRLMMVAFYAAHLATVTHFGPENVAANRIAIVSIAGSAGALLAWQGIPIERTAALFIIAFGLALLTVSGTQREYMREAVRARFVTEDAAIATQRALDVVAAERDAKTRFVAAASHDLGQPLQAAALFFDQAMRAPDAPARAAAADGVRRAFAAAEQLLSQMLNHLQLESDAVRPQVSPVPLGPLLTTLAERYGPQAEAAGMAIHRVATSHVALTDPALIDRALGNLIANAVIHSGGSRMVLGVRSSARALRIWVIDDGSGIAAADAPHIFDDYYRGSTATTSAQSGFGIGLASTRRIANVLGGQVGREPNWEQGSAFFIELPRLGGDRYGLSERRIERVPAMRAEGEGNAVLPDC